MLISTSVAVSKMCVVLHQAWSENQQTVLLEYLTISTMSDVIKHIVHRVSKNDPFNFLLITLATVDRFLIFFHY